MKKVKKEKRSSLGTALILPKDVLEDLEKEIRDHERGIGKTYRLEDVVKEFEKEKPGRRRNV